MATTKKQKSAQSSQQSLFHAALKRARGRAEQVIVVFVDVRGFSAFSSSRDSVDIGLYVRRFFLSLMNDFFPHASYHKSTGDGMMIIFPYHDEKSLKRIAKDVIDSSVKLHSEFSDLASLDNMITFESPNSCGIGINRGTVCCIESDGETLDYSGHVLNLAARLMDLARPAGFVMHASLGNMIPEEYEDLFEISSVYVRGIAENQPVPVYSLRGITTIPEAATTPPPEPWGTYTKVWRVEDVTKLSTRYSVDVPNIVTKSTDVVVRCYSPHRVKGVRAYNDINEFSVKKVADKTEIQIETKVVKQIAAKHKATDAITLEVKYRQK